MGKLTAVPLFTTLRVRLKGSSNFTMSGASANNTENSRRFTETYEAGVRVRADMCVHQTCLARRGKGG